MRKSAPLKGVEFTPSLNVCAFPASRPMENDPRKFPLRSTFSLLSQIMSPSRTSRVSPQRTTEGILVVAGWGWEGLSLKITLVGLISVDA